MFTAALQCTVVCQKPGAGVLGVGPVSSSNMAPSGWGQILACARICPPASHWMWRPTSPLWRDPCPESHSQHCSDYPAIILSLGYYLLLLLILALDYQFWFWYQLSRKPTHWMAEKLPFFAWLFADLVYKWPTPATAPRTWSSDDTQLLLIFTIFSRVWFIPISWPYGLEVIQNSNKNKFAGATLVSDMRRLLLRI